MCEFFRPFSQCYLGSTARIIYNEIGNLTLVYFFDTKFSWMFQLLVGWTIPTICCVKFSVYWILVNYTLAFVYLQNKCDFSRVYVTPSTQ